jgi:hypothetical protein
MNKAFIIINQKKDGVDIQLHQDLYFTISIFILPRQWPMSWVVMSSRWTAPTSLMTRASAAKTMERRAFGFQLQGEEESRGGDTDENKEEDGGGHTGLGGRTTAWPAHKAIVYGDRHRGSEQELAHLKPTSKAKQLRHSTGGQLKNQQAKRSK